MARADEPAFPQTEGMPGLNVTGLSVREWFAGQALIGELARDGTGHYKALADACFAIADAMLAQSEKK